tara:strand:+ start:281 stop:814 length:534 start_codon:yes stop_codon:yes gene_type:complete
MSDGKENIKLETSNNIDDLEEDFKSIQNTLGFFKNMNEGDKIMRDCSNSYYIISNDDWQRTKRWWYSEDRQKTIEYLEEEFKNFAKFLDNVLFNLKKNNLLKYYTLALDISRFISEILIGLYSLKNTYSDCDEMKLKVDSIITTLIDYKDQVEGYKNANKNRRHSLTHMTVKRTKSN